MLVLTLFFFNLDYGKEQETNDTGKDSQTASSGVNSSSARADNGTSGGGATGERASKRSRRNRTELGITSQSDTANNSPDVPATPELPPRREAAPARVKLFYFIFYLWPFCYFFFLESNQPFFRVCV